MVLTVHTLLRNNLQLYTTLLEDDERTVGNETCPARVVADDTTINFFVRHIKPLSQVKKNCDDILTLDSEIM
jgi:hypothetical protein